MSLRNPWRWCAVAGVITFLCSWGFGRIPGLVACGPTGGLGAVIAFEFVGSPTDVAALFGSEPCRSALVGAQKIGLLLDALGFIPAYTTFLILATMASARITDRWPSLAMLVAATIAFAGLCDEIEGVLLYLILIDMPGDPILIDVLWWPVHLKFVLLAIGTTMIGAYLLVRTPGLMSIAAVFIVISGALALWHVAIDVQAAAMMRAFAVAWVTILLCALLGSWRPSLFSAPAAPPPAPASPSA